MDLVRLVVRFNLHPEIGLHPSWLPADWPSRHRVPARLGEAGRAVLADQLRRAQGPDAGSADYNFDARFKRVALLDADALRRLAAYLGFCVHLPLFRLRGGGVMGDLAGMPAAQLAVLPGSSHFLPPGQGVLDRADWMHAMIRPFLEAPDRD